MCLSNDEVQCKLYSQPIYLITAETFLRIQKMPVGRLKTQILNICYNSNPLELLLCFSLNTFFSLAVCRPQEHLSTILGAR